MKLSFVEAVKVLFHDYEMEAIVATWLESRRASAYAEARSKAICMFQPIRSIQNISTMLQLGKAAEDCLRTVRIADSNSTLRR